MCNLYSHTSNVQAIIDLTRATRSLVGNLPPQPGIFPDYEAPIVRTGADGAREIAMARWGMPSSQLALMEAAKKRAAKLEAKGQAVDLKELLRLEPDSGTTNIRNTASKHWQRWLRPENRCLVPFTSFSEFSKAAGGDVWFAFSEARPLAMFAGIWTAGWTSVRKMKTGVETLDLFGFLTTEPSEPVASIHPKAMPVTLTEPRKSRPGCATLGKWLKHCSGHCRLGRFRSWPGERTKTAPEMSRAIFYRVRSIRRAQRAGP